MKTAMGERVLWGKRGREKRQGTQEKQETVLAMKLSASPTKEQKGISLPFV